jgi:hypothetical protein
VSFGPLIPLSVHWDELDALGMLHNSRYPLLVERAWLGLWQQEGFHPDGSDAFQVVTELRVPTRCRSPVPVRTPSLCGWSGWHRQSDTQIDWCQGQQGFGAFDLPAPRRAAKPPWVADLCLPLLRG